MRDERKGEREGGQGIVGSMLVVDGYTFERIDAAVRYNIVWRSRFDGGLFCERK